MLHSLREMLPQGIQLASCLQVYVASGSASAFWSKSPALPGVPGKDWSRVLPFWGQQETPLGSISDRELLIDWSSALQECLKRFLSNPLPPSFSSHKLDSCHSVKVLPCLPFPLPFTGKTLNRSFALLTLS